MWEQESVCEYVRVYEFTCVPAFGAQARRGGWAVNASRLPQCALAAGTGRVPFASARSWLAEGENVCDFPPGRIVRSE